MQRHAGNSSALEARWDNLGLQGDPTRRGGVDVARAGRKWRVRGPSSGSDRLNLRFAVLHGLLLSVKEVQQPGGLVVQQHRVLHGVSLALDDQLWGAPGVGVFEASGGRVYPDLAVALPLAGEPGRYVPTWSLLNH